MSLNSKSFPLGKSKGKQTDSVLLLPHVFHQEIDANSMMEYKKSIMTLSDRGRLYRTELEIVLCKESLL